MITVSIKDKSYVVGESMAKTLVDVAKEAMKDKLAIVALKRDNFQEMRKDEFNTLEEMAQATELLVVEGWTVITTKGDIQ